MFRRNKTRRLAMDCLEDRRVLSTTTPTGSEQYLLELINQARTNPVAAADRIQETISPETIDVLAEYRVNLDQALKQIASAEARPPVAWDSELAQAAEDHSKDQVKRNVQSHFGAHGETLADRLDAVGYDDFDLAAENIISKVDSEDEAMQAFLIDWNNPGLGHRKNIQQTDESQADLTEVGIAVVNVPTRQTNPFLSPADAGPDDQKILVTQVFGRPNDVSSKVVGVVYRDQSGDDFYTAGEGVQGATIKLINSTTGSQYTATTWSSGGYQVEVPSGTYRVVAESNGTTTKVATVKVRDENVKVDFDLNDAVKTVADSPKPVAVPTPPPAPVTKPAPQQPNTVPAKPAPAPIPEPPPTQPVIQPEPTPANEPAPEPTIVVDTPPAQDTSTPDTKVTTRRVPSRGASEMPRSLSLLIRYRSNTTRRAFTVGGSPVTTVVTEPASTGATPRPSSFRFWKV
jgi:uncharacterized protein YkwD